MTPGTRALKGLTSQSRIPEQDSSIQNRNELYMQISYEHVCCLMQRAVVDLGGYSRVCTQKYLASLQKNVSLHKN